MAQVYSEEDLKKILKGLAGEKEVGSMKLPESAYPLEELLTLKSAYESQEMEISQLQTQLDRVKPAIKKLIDELLAAKEEMAAFKAKEKELGAQLMQALEEKNTSKVSQEAFLQLERRCMELEVGFEKERSALVESVQEKQKTLSREVLRAQNFEQEKNHLVERLAESVSQNQRLSEMVKELREEIHTHDHQQSKELERALEDCERLKTELRESDANQVRLEYEEKLKKMREELIESKSYLEEQVNASYAKLKELYSKNMQLIEEMHLLSEKQKESEQVKRKLHMHEADIQKAQEHLAKKVKESTLLRDILEKQKTQLFELQSALTQSRSDVEKLQGALQLQKLHEEKLEQMSKERVLSSENLVQEWQEKYFALQAQAQSASAEIAQLQKIKKSYEHLSTTFTNLKNCMKSASSDEE